MDGKRRAHWTSQFHHGRKRRWLNADIEGCFTKCCGLINWKWNRSKPCVFNATAMQYCRVENGRAVGISNRT
jgi:hypothetical protein